MALEGSQPTPRPESDSVFGEFYYAHDCGIPYERNEHWLTFFSKVADAIVREIAPLRVLDVGCAMGFLVEQLHARGVEAWGTDISSYAVGQAHPSVTDFCAVSSVLDPLPEHFPSSFDLVTCIEVIEHLKPEEASPALTNLCGWSDRILYSSSPEDFSEATHLAVRTPDQWAASFATHGFLRNFDVNADFLTPWAVVYDRVPFAISDVVARYERRVTRQAREIAAVRGQLLKLHEEMAHLPGDGPTDTTVVDTLLGEISTLRGHVALLEGEIDSLGRSVHEREADRDRLRALVGADERAYEELRLNLWSVRDHAIAHEAIAAQARAEAAEARAEANGARHLYENVRDHSDAMLASTTWRIGHTLMGPVRRMRRLLGRPV